MLPSVLLSCPEEFTGHLGRAWGQVPCTVAPGSECRAAQRA